jgi:hypothetical protein
MAKSTSADIRIIQGSGILEPGPGHVNLDGIAARDGGRLSWADVAAVRCIERRAGNAAAGALAAGSVGLLGGPPIAAMAAAGGALVTSIGGARQLHVLRTSFGADILIEIGAWRASAIKTCFDQTRRDHAARLTLIESAPMRPSAAQRLRQLMKREDKTGSTD